MKIRGLAAMILTVLASWASFAADAAADPLLCVDNTNTIERIYTIGDALPADAVRVLSNCGDGVVPFGVECVPTVDWLQFTPAVGNIAAGATKNVAFSFDPRGLPEGVHSVIVTFWNTGGLHNRKSVRVAIEVRRPPEALCVDSDAAVAASYVIGSDVPADVLRSVVNCGRPYSLLDWTAVADPPAEWLSIDATSGTLAGEASQAVIAHFDVAGLAPGDYATTLRFENAGDPSQFATVDVGLEVIEPIADLRLVDDVDAVTVGYTIGDPRPAAALVAVMNDGHPLSTLHYAVSLLAPAEWLSLEPAAGELAPGADPAGVTLAFDPTDLTDGPYETVVRFQNAADPSDFADVAVTLSVENILFAPGDRLIGQIGGFDDSHEVEFDAVRGMRLILKVTSPSESLKAQFVLADADDNVVDTAKVNHSKKPVKRTFKVPESGRYKLRIETVKGTLGDFDVKTNRKLPRQAKPFVKSGGGGAADTLPVRVLALPGAEIHLVAKPKNFAGPLSLVVLTPEGAVFDASGFVLALANGGLDVSGLMLDAVGEWTFGVTGFSKKKHVAKVTVEPVQPPKGTAIIVLP